ncbi:BMP family ABC transporter substrate-binding protein [Clostridium perfringens]|uniref:BMP family lipoprotein n=1 Tax=Clostridium perfringens TaxID=1502 RepID=UPI0022E77DCF|nr:BMP family ABC transporter substrate-binding protein [Clostridium perfringens]MDG6884772.1 Membrane lipoprotein TmpC precursor [Clostridium perfringens]MDH5077352.1 Membrane lipoprotein TmpC precursor [Clostridium perfringens]MDK0720255.1 BMP family ABC transporter substrate-binding protein [Clostridium perfringens]MDK0769136.1 BMP family ABC transporter substrate-binding protein [Clostridium perfringens]MDK0771835.1 BMP family ABC transporter substrate-binding protein [Clostridium perfring
MKLKKTFKVLALLLGVTSIIVGCGANNSSALKKADIIEKQVYNFALVKDDFSNEENYFADSAVEGLERIKKEYSAEIEVFDTNSSEDYEKRLREAAQNNDLTFASAFKFLESLNNVAKDYPDKNFAIVDTISDLPNVKSIDFKDEEGAFLMGIIAGNATKTNKVGFIGAIKEESIERFSSGFMAGLKVSNEEAYKNIREGNLVQYIGNFNDQKKASDIAKKMYDEGADIIFESAGEAGKGLFRAAKEKGKYAIGADIDWAERFPEYANVILSSMIKNLDEAVYTTAKEVINSDFKAGPNNKMEVGLKDNGIEIAKTTSNLVSKEILDKVEKYRVSIINGEFNVPKTLDEVENFNIK